MSKNNDNRIILPEPTIRRLPWYLSYVRMLDNLHVDYVSSTQISKELNVQSSQIAKDLSFLNIRGKTRIGYEVRSLVTELEDFLGFNQHHDAVVIGTGSLGTALMQDHGLEHYGLNIVAGFDVRDEVIGMASVDGDSILLTVSEEGKGRLTPVSDFTLQQRGGQGMRQVI